MTYTLRPFPQSGIMSDLRIECDIERQRNSMVIKYHLLGNLSEILMPGLSSEPERRNGLWKETCFELFIAERNSSKYWEFNASSAGHWNVYRFIDYRQGMEEESAFSSLPLTIEKQKNSFYLSLNLKLNNLIREEQSINAALSVVVKSVPGEITYYALTHTGEEADFHKRDSFIVSL